MRDKIRNMGKKEKYSLLVTLFIAVSLVILGSFAFFSAVLNGSLLNKVSFNVPVFSFNFTESNSVTLTNPDPLSSSEEADSFPFSVTGSTADPDNVFDIDYTIYLKLNANNTIPNIDVSIQLFDDNGTALTDVLNVSDLSLVAESTDKYIIHSMQMQLYNNTLSHNFVLKYWYNNTIPAETNTSSDNSQTIRQSLTGTFEMSLNVLIDNTSFTLYSS